jgi:Flp pilus assembly protein TadD
MRNPNDRVPFLTGLHRGIRHGAFVFLGVACLLAWDRPALAMKGAERKAGSAEASALDPIRRQIAANRLADAERLVWAILSREKENPGAFKLLGEIRSRQKRYDEAAALFRHCIDLNSTASSCHQNLAGMLVLQGHDEDATKEFLVAKKLDPANIDIKIQLAAAYSRQGQHDKTTATLEEIPRPKLPASAVPLFGRSLIATGRTSDAVALIPRVQTTGSKSDAIALAEVFTSAQLPNEALNCLSKVLQQPQVPTRAWYVLGVASEEKHDFASARRAYQRAVAEDARFAEALSALGALALKEGESGKAVDFLQRASAASSAGKEEFAEIQRRLIVAALKARREDVVRTAAAALFALNTKRQEDLYLTGTAFLWGVFRQRSAHLQIIWPRSPMMLALNMHLEAFTSVCRTTPRHSNIWSGALPWTRAKPKPGMSWRAFLSQWTI